MTAPGTLRVTGPFETTDLRVVDANMHEVGAGTHALTVDLAPGIYRVVAQVPGARHEKLVLVEAGRPTDVGDFTLHWDSVAPHASSRSKHEYQTDPAKQHSTQTHVSVGAGPQARLFVFVRTAGDPRSEAPAFRLTDGDGEVLAAFPEVGVADLPSGWAALSAHLPAGTYQLEHDVPSLGRRAQAVFVEDGWQTQVFVPWREIADFASAVIYMKRHAGFDPAHAWAYTRIEAALQGLANGKVIIDPTEIDDFLNGKFDNPMLGLIGAYALLAAGEVNRGRLRIVARNLLRLAPHSPDAKLLSLLADARGEVAPPKPPVGWPVFEAPPMFALGTSHLLNVASRVRDVCPADSWFGRVSMTLVTDGPWTRWEPGLETPEAVTKLKRQLDALFQDSVRRVSDFVDNLAEGLSRGTLRIVKKDQIAAVLNSLLNQGAPPLVRALQDAGLLQIDRFIGHYADQIARKLAPELQLPVSVVAEALRKLMQERRGAASAKAATPTRPQGTSVARRTGAVPAVTQAPPARRSRPKNATPSHRAAAQSRRVEPRTQRPAAGRKAARRGTKSPSSRVARRKRRPPKGGDRA